MSCFLSCFLSNCLSSVCWQPATPVPKVSRLYCHARSMMLYRYYAVGSCHNLIASLASSRWLLRLEVSTRDLSSIRGHRWDQYRYEACRGDGLIIRAGTCSKKMRELASQ